MHLRLSTLGSTRDTSRWAVVTYGLIAADDLAREAARKHPLASARVKTFGYNYLRYDTISSGTIIWVRYDHQASDYDHLILIRSDNLRYDTTSSGTNI